MSQQQTTDAEMERLRETVPESKAWAHDAIDDMAEIRSDMVSMARNEIRMGGNSEWGTNLIKEYAEQGHAEAQEAADELGIEMAAAEQNPQANSEFKNQFGSDDLEPESPYDRPWLYGGADPPHMEGSGGRTPYDAPDNENRRVHDGTFESWQGDDGPQANDAEDDEPDGPGPRTSGSFADYQEKEGDR